MNVRLRALAGLAGLSLLVALGCNKSNDVQGDPPSSPGGPGGPGMPKPNPNATPQELFDQQCAKCHRSGGQPGAPRGKMGGPDLTKTAEDPAKNADWIAEHIKNPKTHNPMSRMPAFEANLTPDQIKKLADYVVGLKP